ncbi:MAG: dienelactone hydrolase family protein, partial [Nitrososphaera sp.]
MIGQSVNRHIMISEDIGGELTIPFGARTIVLFSHGRGSDRSSPRNQLVASMLNNKRIATFLVDLLGQHEKNMDIKTKQYRYDLEFLCRRFEVVSNWISQHHETTGLNIGYFGSSAGAAIALICAERLGLAKAIVTRGGRVDLIDERILNQIKAPTLFIVGSNDVPLIAPHKRALGLLRSAEAKELAIIPDATHLFAESGKMEEVACIANNWFECYLLRSGKTFENRYSEKGINRFFSSIRRKYSFQIKFKDRSAAGELLASIL